jgi:hypothetical protein
LNGTDAEISIYREISVAENIERKLLRGKGDQKDEFKKVSFVPCLLLVPENKRPLERPKGRWWDNVQVNLRETRSNVDRIRLGK